MGYLIFWGICAAAGSLIGYAKGAEGDGFAFGLLFGPLGVCGSLCLQPRFACSKCGCKHRDSSTVRCMSCGAFFVE